MKCGSYCANGPRHSASPNCTLLCGNVPQKTTSVWGKVAVIPNMISTLTVPPQDTTLIHHWLDIFFVLFPHVQPLPNPASVTSIMMRTPSALDQTHVAMIPQASPSHLLTPSPPLITVSLPPSMHVRHTAHVHRDVHAMLLPATKVPVLVFHRKWFYLLQYAHIADPKILLAVWIHLTSSINDNFLYMIECAHYGPAYCLGIAPPLIKHIISDMSKYFCLATRNYRALTERPV